MDQADSDPDSHFCNQLPQGAARLSLLSSLNLDEAVVSYEEIYETYGSTLRKFSESPSKSVSKSSKTKANQPPPPPPRYLPNREALAKVESGSFANTLANRAKSICRDTLFSSGCLSPLLLPKQPIGFALIKCAFIVQRENLIPMLVGVNLTPTRSWIDTRQTQLAQQILDDTMKYDHPLTQADYRLHLRFQSIRIRSIDDHRIRTVLTF